MSPTVTLFGLLFGATVAVVGLLSLGALLDARREVAR